MCGIDSAQLAYRSGSYATESICGAGSRTLAALGAVAPAWQQLFAHVGHAPSLSRGADARVSGPVTDPATSTALAGELCACGECESLECERPCCWVWCNLHMHAAAANPCSGSAIAKTMASKARMNATGPI